MDQARLTTVLSTSPMGGVLGQEKTGQTQKTAAYGFLAAAAGDENGRASVASRKARRVAGSEGPKTLSASQARSAA